MIILDTNVVSELIRPTPDEGVVAWVDRHETAELFLTAITAAELRAGVALFSTGKRRRRLAVQVDALLDDDFADAVVAFDVASASQYGNIVAVCRAKGTPMSTADTQIAAICRQFDAVLATRNTADFRNAGIRLVNPWTTQ